MSVLYGFCKNGKLKLAYSMNETFISDLRKDIILFIRENTIEQLNEICDKICLVDEKSEPSEEQLKELISKGIMYKARGRLLTWGEIFNYNGTILSYYKDDCYYLPDYSELLGDVFREKLYIINLDENKFEIYFKCDNESSCKYDGYELKAVYDLDNIPRNWDKML